MNSEAIGNLILFQMAILGADYLPQVITKSAAYWAWRWDDMPGALRLAWVRMIGREGWDDWEWSELVPEMQAHVMNQAAKLGKVAQARLAEFPGYRRNFPELRRAAA